MWVFGMVDTSHQPALGYMQIVPDRRVATLLPIIETHVANGSIIHSDEWRAYRQVSSLRPVTSHGTVNHSVTFVDPVTGVYNPFWRMESIQASVFFTTCNITWYREPLCNICWSRHWCSYSTHWVILESSKAQIKKNERVSWRSRSRLPRRIYVEGKVREDANRCLEQYNQGYCNSVPCLVLLMIITCSLYLLQFWEDASSPWSLR